MLIVHHCKVENYLLTRGNYVYNLKIIRELYDKILYHKEGYMVKYKSYRVRVSCALYLYILVTSTILVF